MPPTARAPPLAPGRAGPRRRARRRGRAGQGRAPLAGRPAGQLGAERIVLRQRRRAERRHRVGQAGPPRGRILVEHAEDRGLDLGRALLAALADPRRRALDVRLHHRERGAGEQRHAGQQLVEHRAERVLVRRARDLAAAALLGAHVGGRPHQGAGQRPARPLGRLGDPEVGDDRVALFVDQDVAGLDVAMDHPRAMSVGERGAHLVQDRPDDRQRQPARALHHVLERAPLHVPHHEEVEAFRLPHRVDRHDVRMMQLGDGDGLVLEALDHPFAQEQAGRHDLDGHLAVERDLVREEDGRHPASAELAADLELAEGGAPQPLDDVGHRRGRVIRGVQRHRERRDRRACRSAGRRDRREGSAGRTTYTRPTRRRTARRSEPRPPARLRSADR